MEHCLTRLSRARAMARLLSLQTLSHLAADRPDEAVDTVVCLLRMLRMFERPPVAIAHLVEVAITSMTCRDVKIILETARPSDERWTLLQQSLLATDSKKTLETVILAERAYGLELMGAILAGTGQTGIACDAMTGPQGQWPRGAFWGRPILRHMAVQYLRDMNTLLGDARKPLPDVLATSQVGGQTKPSSGGMVGLSLPRGLILSQRAIAEVRCAAVAIMIEQYRRANGRLPQSLQDLVPAFAPSLPLDPFTGSDLAYRHDRTAYVVYSLGDNRQDDEGDVDAGQNGRTPRDFGLRVRLPAATPASPVDP